VASGATVVPQPSLSSASKQFAPNILHQAKRFVTRLRRLPRISQGLLGGAILLILVLIVSVSVNTSRQETAQTTASNSELVTSVQQDIKKASDTLLFRDEATALALLSGAEARLETEVIPSGAASEEELTLLQASLADVYDQIDKITRLDGLTPTLAIDNASPRGLIESGDERLFYTATDVYGFTDSGAIRLRATQPDGTSEQFVGAFQDADGGKTVLLGSAGSLFTFNPDTDALGLVDGSVPDGADLQGGAQYNNNLYVLNRTDDQILKFRPAGSGFATGTSWIADGGVSLASATDLAIDGDIYVLFQNGTIEKYLSGSRQEFTLGTPSKPYTSATHLATSSNANRLVLLDPSTLRLGVFDKATGELTAQYEADVFAGALDLFLNDSGSQATVLTSDGIYEVGL
ncbi:MAG: hypothetical protein KC653_03405, partial [Candidatus Andersenbacteria bacterium]|nr:hypothetical protein [Candidatus Andersenbacteria bacterium]